MSILDIFKKKTVKRPLRDKHGRPYYLTNIPWYRRNPRLFVFGGGILTVCVVFSKPLYDLFIRSPEDVPPQGHWLQHEKERGIRDVDVLRAKRAAAGPNATLKQVFDTPPDFEKMPPSHF